VTDGASIGMGTRAFVGGTGPIGYGIAAYSTSVTIDNTKTIDSIPGFSVFHFLEVCHDAKR